jgi:hypothetical protein
MEVEFAISTSPKPDFVVRVMCILCGLGMIVLSALNYQYYVVNVALDVVLPLYYW